MAKTKKAKSKRKKSKKRTYRCRVHREPSDSTYTAGSITETAKENYAAEKENQPIALPCLSPEHNDENA